MARFCSLISGTAPASMGDVAGSSNMIENKNGPKSAGPEFFTSTIPSTDSATLKMTHFYDPFLG